MPQRRCPILIRVVECARDCAACQDEFGERSAIIQHATHPPLASTRADADRIARGQLADSLPGQRAIDV